MQLQRLDLDIELPHLTFLKLERCGSKEQMEDLAALMRAKCPRLVPDQCHIGTLRGTGLGQRPDGGGGGDVRMEEEEEPDGGGGGEEEEASSSSSSSSASLQWQWEPIGVTDGSPAPH